MSKKPSVWKNLPNGVTVRRNRLSEQWAAYPIEMLQSPAYRALSLSACRLLHRIEIELAAHGGNDIERLPVTKADFVQYGISPRLVAPAIREAEALGFIRITNVAAAAMPSIAPPICSFQPISTVAANPARLNRHRMIGVVLRRSKKPSK